MKPPEDPTGEPNDLKFTLQVVTMNGKQEHWACTKAVYQWALATKPHLNVHVEWVLTLEPVTNLVTHVTESLKPNSMPGFNRTDDGKEPSKNVIITLYPDGSAAPTNIPERVGEDIVSEIQTLVVDAENDIHMGQKIGRFIVSARHEEVGMTHIHVDPMPR